MNERYYYSVTGSDVLGPLPLSEIGAVIKNNTMTSETMVCKEGEEDWNRYVAVVHRMNQEKYRYSLRPSQRPMRELLAESKAHNGNKQFTVLHHPVYGYKAVKSGFSWPAFFFAPVWAIIHRLWPLFLGLVAMGGVIVFLEAVELAWLSWIFRIAVFLGIGIHGNEMLQAKLLSRGFMIIKAVYADSPDDALAVVVRGK